MNICLVSDSYPTLPKYGGLAVFTRLAAQALAARGHDVHVVVCKSGEYFDVKDGTVSVHGRRVRWLPLLARWFPGLGESFCLAWWLTALHRRWRFDVIEVPNWEGIGLIVALLPGPSLVVRLHTSMAESIAVTGRLSSSAERFMIWMEKTSARMAKRVVTHSEAHRLKLEKDYGIRNVSVISHGIVLPPLASPSPEEYTVLSVGPCNVRKGTETLLAAIPIVLEQLPKAEFWLAGIAEDHARARQFRLQHPELQSDKVRFLGFVESAKLRDFYARCAVYASASVYESFGLTFVEAMACGKPVVGCAVSAMPEIIGHEKTGLLVPPADPVAFAAAIVRLLSDESLRSRLGREGRRVAQERFSADRMAERIEKFYRETIAAS